MHFYTDSDPTPEIQGKQLLQAAREDDVDLVTELLAKPGECDVNFQDG